MLGRKGFTFDTPNVIDPGEQAPSRPSRREAATPGKSMIKENLDDNSPSSGRRLTSFSTTVLLDSNKGIDNISKPYPHIQGAGERNSAPRYSFSSGPDHFSFGDSDADDDAVEDEDLDSVDTERQAINAVHASSKLDQEYGEMDDDEFDRAVDSQLPSVEEARKFAATILQETDRRSSSDLSPIGIARKGRSLKSMLSSRRIGGWNDDSLYNLQGGTMETVPLSSRPKRRLKICGNWLMYVALASVALIFTMSVVGRMRKGGLGQDRITDRFVALRTFVVANKISYEEDLVSSGSPQFQAAQWIADDDALKLPIPDDSDAVAVAQAVDTTQLIQRYVLAVMFFSLNGKGWEESMGFLSGEHECGWFRTVEKGEDGGFDRHGAVNYQYDRTNTVQGVVCDDTLQVRNLIIPSNNLGGSIPEEIGFLTRVDAINFSGNGIRDLIPENISRLTLLRYLDLNYNKLAGGLPEGLGDLTNLEILGLSNNLLDGAIPEGMELLEKLQTLAIDSNFFTGDISPLYGMRRIKYLYADNNALESDGNYLEPFGDMNELVELDLSSNVLTMPKKGSELPKSLFDRPLLQVLDLSDNLQLAPKLPAELPLNSKLRFLSLRSTSSMGHIPSSISNLRALTHLDLEANSFTGTMPQSVGELKGLNFLFLGRNPFEKEPIPSNYEHLTNLRELSMDGTQRTGQLSPWFVNNWRKLKLLDVRNNQLTGAISQDIQYLSDMTFLLLSGNTFDGQVPESIASLSNLSIFAMHNNHIEGDVSAALCQEGGQSLDILTTDCSKIKCTCCSSCCEEGNEECFGDVVWDRLEFFAADWEANYNRSSYSFDPKSLDRNDDS